MRAIERVVQALEANGCNPRRNSSGYSFKCPAHDDHHPSGSLTEQQDRVLIRCHAGCRTEDILVALGLTFVDLYDDPGTSTPRLVMVYDYHDEDRKILYQVARYDPKAFRQRRPNGQGGFFWNLDGTRRVLYRLPDLIETVCHGATVYITEGEKDADAINALNSDAPSPSFIATCNPGGAGKWRSEYNPVLRNANVIIIADKDEAGRKHALQVAESLKGVAATIEIREAAIGKDAADHLAAGRTLEDFPLVEPNFSGVESPR